MFRTENKQLVLLVIFICINSVKSINLYNNRDVNHKNIQETTLIEHYNFNHPPSVDYYNPIPVAVVYEEDEISQGKSIKSTSNESFEDFTEAKNINENKNSESTITLHKINNVAVIDKNIENVKLKPKQLVLNDYQIPVSVIYESESDVSERDSYKRVKYSADDKSSNRRRQHEPRKENVTLETQYESDKVQITNKEKNTISQKRTRQRAPVIPIIESENYVFSHSGNFHYSYEGGDGTKAYSRGELIRNEEDEAGEAVVGGFSYKDKDGNDVSLSYTADENGYRPVGAHLPTPPPIPPAIARALRYLATVTTPEPATETLTGF